MTQFAFLKPEFAAVYEPARKAEMMALSDARGACFNARLALEMAVKWMYANDRSLHSAYDEALSALIHEATFRNLVGPPLVTKAKLIKDLGNKAVHDARPVTAQEAVNAVRELFHFSYWLVRTYARGEKPSPGIGFNPNALERTHTITATTLQQMQKLRADTEARERALEAEKAERLKSEAQRTELEAEIARLQVEIAAVKQANQAAPDTHDYNEAETRDAFIDLLLSEAGWPLDQKRDREYKLKGMPSDAGVGYADYVLWGDDGKPLGVVEAKRTKRDARVGQQQAKLYADCLEAEFGARPIIFYTNGYEHFLWDDTQYPPRPVQGFLKKDELMLLHQRRTAKRSLATVDIDSSIVERYYQTRAIRRVGETFEKEHQRKALLVMATGSGKTRTVIALIDQLMRANLVKRALFLADRVALVNQTVGAFKTFLPHTSPVNLITEKQTEGRLYVSTYPTMMGLIDEMQNGVRRFGTGHFDLIVIDEAHRSVYRKYRAIFDYFDCLLVGLTATPRDEIDRDTYSLFELERGVPTDSYDLDEAVSDGFLVPPRAVSVPLKFQQHGIKYEDLPEEDKEKWDMLEWEDGEHPDEVNAAAVNKWLFNDDTVDKVLKHLMTHGLKVEDGDRLGKTIIFAKNHDHAMFIAERFDANYPHLKGHFARVIDFKTEYVQSLIDDFSNPEKAPHIAISVDMLDTGIDVPEVVNLVFFKIVRSKTKFWQMIGRGTRLRKNLYGPGKDKDQFLVFDFCQNFEYFNENPPAAAGSSSAPLGQRLFAARVSLLAEIDALPDALRSEDMTALRLSTRTRLYDEVMGMSMNNFIVRPKRKQVEQFQNKEAWEKLDEEARQCLVQDIAGLPTAYQDDDLAARQFDYFVLSGQLALMRTQASFSSFKQKMIALASRLESLGNVPMVAAEMPLILDLQTDEYWQDVNAPMLEHIRKRLRLLIKLVEGEARPTVYTDFEDEIGDGVDINLPDAGSGTDKTRFQMKVRHFLKQHADHIAIQKLRRDEQLTAQDLSELERIMLEESVASNEDLQRVRADGGLGLFIRSLVGLEREAAKQAMAAFMEGRALTANQIEFVNLIVDYLTERGAMDPRRLYESPFTDFDDQGVGGVFSATDVSALVQILNNVRKRAAA